MLSAPPRSRSSAASTALTYDSRGGTAVTCISANAACGAESAASRSNDIGAEPSTLPTSVSRVMSSVASPHDVRRNGEQSRPAVVPNGSTPTATGADAAIAPRGGERFPHRRVGATDEAIARGHLDTRGRAATDDAVTRALEEEPVRRLVRGQQVERRTQRASRRDLDGIAHARVPTRSCVMPPDS